jgi:pyruvate kinase
LRKTKIICTIGPASQNVEILVKLIENGMNVARLNFSHGSHQEHKERVDNIRKATALAQRQVAIMLDTRGPEIRTGTLANSSTVNLAAGQEFILTNRAVPGDERAVQINYPALPREVKPGDSILLADGLINLQVRECSDTDILCTVVNGGVLGERKGVNVPGVRINLPFLSPKDREDILFGIANQVDIIAASFVRKAEDILEIRKILEDNNADIFIIAKIESKEGVDNLEDIIKVADGIMVARGDLGVEIPVEEVPLVQKMIIEKCAQSGKVVIIATQMLESMINNPRPTRAEVSDVANAIFDKADAIMLSGETAAGKYPVEVVETMARIARRAEQALPYREILRKKRMQGRLTVTDAISFATCTTAMNLGASAILTATRTGYTARMVSKYRPEAKIVAATPSLSVLKKLSLVWGVYPILINDEEGTDALLDGSINSALAAGLIDKGDLIVLTAGVPTGLSGETNLLKVHVVGDILVQGMGIGTHPVNGRARVVMSEEDLSQIEDGDIIITINAHSYLSPYLGRIKGLVAEEGGLTSNAAIMGLTANIPVIVGASEAVRIIQNGMLITLDTPSGKVYRGFTKII